MKRFFEVEFDDDLGPYWMNKDNLQLCIDSTCKPGLCRVTKDLTQDIENGREEYKNVLAGFMSTLPGNTDKHPEEFVSHAEAIVKFMMDYPTTLQKPE